jgi:hypothetical protein
LGRFGFVTLFAGCFVTLLAGCFVENFFLVSETSTSFVKSQATILALEWTDSDWTGHHPVLDIFVRLLHGGNMRPTALLFYFFTNCHSYYC